MQLRPLGRSGLSVPPLAFGGNVFGWTVNEDDSFSILDALVDQGLNFIDTADMYSRWAPGNRGGESEVIIGKWLARTGRRADIILATKVGMEMGPKAVGLSAAYIARAIEDSLARLQTDYVDLYQSHQDDSETPIAETLGAYAKLIENGKVRAIGASNFTATRLSESLIESERHGLPRYEAVQPEYNLYTREPFEAHLRAVVTTHELATINYSALASGFLSGKYRAASDASLSPRGPGVISKYLNARGERILAALDEVALSHQVSVAQAALAWQMAQPGITAPIASASTLDQVADLGAAARLTLAPEALDLLTRASDWREAHAQA
ncbi:MAG: aldo/keto reductase [Burkholderiaceae bacterium]